MTRRINVTLDPKNAGKMRFVPQVMQQTDVDEVSVKKWSKAAVEKMFESASEELDKVESYP